MLCPARSISASEFTSITVEPDLLEKDGDTEEEEEDDYNEAADDNVVIDDDFSANCVLCAFCCLYKYVSLFAVLLLLLLLLISVLGSMQPSFIAASSLSALYSNNEARGRCRTGGLTQRAKRVHDAGMLSNPISVLRYVNVT